MPLEAADPLIEYPIYFIVRFHNLFLNTITTMHI